MKEVLSRVGIGSATVDTVLPTTTLTAGESVDAEVHVEGGSTDQEVDAIYFALLTRYETDDSTRTGVVDKFRVADPFTIEAGERRTFAVTIDVPRDTPVTVGRTNVWLETGLDIDWAVDPDDEDPLQVAPGPRLATVFDALESLGFTVRTAECEAAPGGLFSGSFVQEIEFVPRSGPFSGRLDELEVVPRPTADSLEVGLEVDRRGGLLSEMSDLDERLTRLRFTDESADEVERRLREEIETHA
ncbi:sporulation protein [Halomicrococcus sp. NG-SE-24]|uniref:sporulation protein n=1 Tax=Halomicrococcus sp. NG-SE-24 TaxID=3436928 RepID=UPI003D99B85B